MPDPAPPAVGDEINLHCQALNTAITVRSKPMQVDFTGECSMRVAPDAGGALPLVLTSMRLRAELPDAGGAEDGGTIALELRDTDLTATIVQPGGRIELISREPVEQGGALPRFPPHDQPYRLGSQVDLVVPGSPDVTTAQLHELVLSIDERLTAPRG
ncbi:MAG: hypothetical protein ABW215_02655 [Kibdelosporangium sp.]